MAAMLLIATFIYSVALAAAASVTNVASQHGAWEPQQRAPSDARVTLHLALRQEDNGDAVIQNLKDVADPTSKYFRQFQPDASVSLSSPSSESEQVVEDWLAKHDLQLASYHSGIITVQTNISQAEALLNASYQIFSDGAQHIVRTKQYSLPPLVAPHLDFVTPTTNFVKPRHQKHLESVFQDQSSLLDKITDKVLDSRSTCGANDLVTPSCVRQVYGVDYQAQPNKTTFAVYATEGATFSANDLKTYLQRYNAPAASAGATYTVVGNGGTNESSGIGPAFETALDTQTLLGLAWPAQGILYNRGGVFGPNPGQVYDNFVQFLHELMTNETVPSVVSFSESMPEDMVEPAYARRLCNMMAQVGARGVTLLFSSGDNGPNGDQPSGTHNKIFEPEFPASCPFVTSVGGTTNLAAETGATQSTIPLLSKISYQASGGGFSNLFPLPWYQNTSVPTYVSTQIPASYSSVSGFNAFGRGIPDISAFSTNVPAVVDFFSVGIAGTSASTPMWAGIVTLLNDYENSKGRPPLGFINPWLYSLGENALKDITTGGNSKGGCNFLAGCKLDETLGYNVTQGWDPVTGLGSPIWSGLVDALETLAREKNEMKA